MRRALGCGFISVAIAAAAMASGCGSDSTSPAAAFDGWWYGRLVTSGNTDRLLELDLALNGQTVTGRGLDRSPYNGSVGSQFTVSGTVVDYTLSLTINGWSNAGDTTCCVTFTGVYMAGQVPQGYVGQLHVHQKARTSETEMIVQRMTSDYEFYSSSR